MILAGGLGTRLAEETVVKPKPMVEIGGRPILDHIMRWYARFGFNEFVVALGYKGEVIKQYFLNYYSLNSDITVALGSGEVTVHEREREDWVVHLVDTGADTQTGGRIKRLATWLSEDTFMMTYGDGVANVDIAALHAFHQQHGRLATVTAVRPPSRFGGLIFNATQVVDFDEKPVMGEGWINGGYFVLDRRVLDYIDGDDSAWERAPIERIVSAGQLMAYQHHGFWQPMDTVRDKQVLENMWNSGQAPWAVAQ